MLQCREVFASVARVPQERTPEPGALPVPPAVVDAALAASGLSRADLVFGRICVLAGERVELAAAAGDAAVRLQTRDLDLMKRLVGASDTDIRAGRVRPSRRRPRCSPAALAGLVPGSREAEAELAAAFEAYCYADTVETGLYREPLVTCMAPFTAFIAGFSRIEIAPGGVLVVSGAPAFVVADEVVLHSGGRIEVFTHCRFVADALTKQEVCA